MTSTLSATRVTWEASSTVSAPMRVGTSIGNVQRPATASAYSLPAEAGLAATATTSNHG